jgi:hypothetical protein
MPRDSSGNYTLPPGNPVVDGTVIDVNWANPTLSDVAVQLNNLITRDGLLGATAPIKFNDGTLALPGITWASEATMGWYRPTANTTVLAIQGTARQIWTPTTTTLNTSLNVATDLGVAGNFTLTGNLDVSGTINFAGGITAAGNFAITGTLDNLLGFTVVNGSAGASAVAGFRGTNNVAEQAALIMTGSGYVGLAAASRTSILYTDSTQGHWIMAALASSVLRFSAGGNVEQMRLTAGGNLGIGTAAPATRVHALAAGAGARFRAQSSDASGVTVEVQADAAQAGSLGTITNHPLTFFTNSGEKGRFKATGEFGIGCVPFANVFLQVRVGTNQNLGVLSLGGGTTIGAFTDAGSSAPMRIAPQVLVVSGDGGAHDQFWFDSNGNLGIGRTPTNAANSLEIAKADDARVVLDGTSASAGAGGTILFYRTGAFVGSLGVSANRLGDSSSRLLLQATSDILFHTGGLTERMRLDSTGKLGIGLTPTFLLDVENAAQAVFRLTMTGGAQVYMQANGGSDGRMGTLNNFALQIAQAGNVRMTVPVSDGAVTERVGGVDYIMSLDPGASGPSMPVGSIIFAAATGVTGGALNGLGVTALGGAVTLTVQAFSGGSPQVTNVGSWRNIGAQTSGIGLWQRVA